MGGGVDLLRLPQRRRRAVQRAHYRGCCLHTLEVDPAGGGIRGYAPDVEIQARELLRMQTKIHEILSEHTGQTVEKIAQDFDRDYYMDAESGVEYGIIDEVLTGPPSEEKEGK